MKPSTLQLACEAAADVIFDQKNAWAIIDHDDRAMVRAAVLAALAPVQTEYAEKIHSVTRSPKVSAGAVTWKKAGP